MRLTERLEFGDWCSRDPPEQEAGKFLAGTVEAARAFRARGFRCIACGTDVNVFQAALGGMIGALKGDG